ncbi:MAG: DUF362 domain-containing protein [Phycisphaerales bacterium]|nr:MAG: DUF362 domain-containing protein [Phycisphaerales bacterium]
MFDTRNNPQRIRAHDGANAGCQVPLHRPRWLQTWTKAWLLASGVFAVLWLLLRSGTRPSRLAYPCQQAAVGTAAAAFGAPLVAALLAARQKVLAALRTPAGLAAAALGVIATAGTWGYLSRADEYRGPVLDPPRDYRAKVFHVYDCPQDPVGDHFVGLDTLIALMGRGGLKFYESPSTSTVAGPDGIIAADDVVLIKVNYQWAERGGTNVDVLRGLIRRIVDHPDTFTGEIVVCENSQDYGMAYFDRDNNNAQDITLSPADVVAGYQSQGHNVSTRIWRALRNTLVDEYSEGDMTEGYVVYPYDDALQGAVSYPKFQTASGTYISLRHGIWDPGTETYDRTHLKFINVPVLKSHGAAYGATACVKDYMGVVTVGLDTNSHASVRYGLLGALLGEIGLADLNILDCIWINAHPGGGPWTLYEDASRRDELVASIDPVAADIWAVTNILIPGFIDNGYSPPWPWPSADPDDPSSTFRTYLDNSMNYILAAAYNVTNDLSQIDVYSWNGAGDVDGDGDVDLADFATFAMCYYGSGVTIPPPGCSADDFNSCDFDDDDDVDLNDFATFAINFTG